jgi:hypothetical protein
MFLHSYRVRSIGKGHFDAEGDYTMMVAGSEEEPPALKIDCVFEVHMHVKPPFDKSHAERFAESELQLILVPYARQFISATTSQMSIPPVIAPLATMKVK